MYFERFSKQSLFISLTTLADQFLWRRYCAFYARQELYFC